MLISTPLSGVGNGTPSSTLAWKIPWMVEPGGLQSMGLWRVGHDWATSLSLFTFMHWKTKCNPLQYSCLENARERGAWWAAVYGAAQSRTRLKRLSSSSKVRTSHTVEKLNNWKIYIILYFKLPFYLESCILVLKKYLIWGIYGPGNYSSLSS